MKKEWHPLVPLLLHARTHARAHCSLVHALNTVKLVAGTGGSSDADLKSHPSS